MRVCVQAGVPTHVWACVLHICWCRCVWARVFICTHSRLGSAHLSPVRLHGAQSVSGPRLAGAVVCTLRGGSCQHSCGATALVVSASSSLTPRSVRSLEAAPGTAVGVGVKRCSRGGRAGPVGAQRFPAAPTQPTGAPRPQPCLWALEAGDPRDRPSGAGRGEGQPLGPLYLARFSVSANEKLAQVC